MQKILFWFQEDKSYMVEIHEQIQEDVSRLSIALMKTAKDYLPK